MGGKNQEVRALSNELKAGHSCPERHESLTKPVMNYADLELPPSAASLEDWVPTALAMIRSGLKLPAVVVIENQMLALVPYNV